MTPMVSAEHPGTTRPSLGRLARPFVAGVMGLLSIAATFLPAVDGMTGEWIALALLVPVVTWCALPIHRAAIRGVASGRMTSWALASVGIAATFAWSIDAALAEDGASGHLVPVVLVTTLMIVACHIAEPTGHDESVDPAPSWLPPLVLAVAAGAWAGWGVADGWRHAGSVGVAVLLVAAPAALLLAEPAAQLVARRRGAEIGVLVAGVDAMRAACRIDTIVLAKNGTVTTGELSVSAVDPVDPEHLRNLRWFAGALAHGSDHPIAHAIAKLAPRGRLSNVVTQPLIGISGAVDRHPVRIGVPRWIGVEGTEGLGTQVAVEVDGRALGWITVGDTVRPDARQGVDRLRLMGLEPILVSNRPEADTTHLADQTGIVTHYPRMTVDGCVALVERLQADGHVVAMVGRLGANAPALRAADLAISTAGEAPDGGVALAEVDVRGVGDAISLMRCTRSTMVANRRWAVIGMLVPLPFAAAGLIAPLYAPLIPLACLGGVIASSAKIPRSLRNAGDAAPNPRP